jgi:hypothetical protein
MNGEQYKLGKVARPHLALLFQDSFQSAKQANWSDKGNPTSVEQSRLVGHGSTWTILRDVNESDVMVSADAKSDAEVGVALRFYDSGAVRPTCQSPTTGCSYWNVEGSRFSLPQRFAGRQKPCFTDSVDSIISGVL